MPRILVIDDEPAICWGLSQLASDMGCDVEVAASAEQGLRRADAVGRFDLLILDVRLPGIDGVTAMAEFRLRLGPVPIIMITAFGDLATAVGVVKNGAFEYVVKPFDLAEIRAAIGRALRTECTGEAARRSMERPVAVDGMLGQSPAMQAVFKRIALAANSETAVLLSGESGVGKELAARAIHNHSRRGGAPFVAVNAAALSPSLAEAELFGHVEGAFTDARQARAGLLAHADGGTLFLDEVADIPLPLQVKLLRALDRGEVLPVGADQPVTIRVRIISATHSDLRAQVQSGEFRHDLYYRLGAFEIVLPPLRQRRDDISMLAERFGTELGDAQGRLAAETLAELERRPWYGNVRELRNAVEHALVVARSGLVLPSHLPPPLPKLQPDTVASAAASEVSNAADAATPLSRSVAELAHRLLEDPAQAGEVYDRFLDSVEPPLLTAALNRWGRQCAPAARALGLHRTTLKRKLLHYGIQHAAGEI